MKLKKKAAFTAICLLGLVVFLAGPAAADYPRKDVMHIIPWSAGGGTDAAMRGFMHHAETYLGKKIINQNITGAQSGVGTSQLIRSRPDGYTIGNLTWDSLITVPYYDLVPGYDLSKLDYICTVSMHPTALVVSKNSPWKTLKDFVEAAQKAPQKISVSNVGSGGVWHLPVLDFAAKAGIQLRHVPYPQGAGPQREALLSGETDAASMSISAAYPALKAGQARVLAVMGDERDEMEPDVPTFKEAGYDVVWGSMRVVAIPKEAPEEAKQKLENVFAKTFKDPKFIAWAKETGMGPYWMDRAQTTQYVKDIQVKSFALIDDLVAKGVLIKK